VSATKPLKDMPYLHARRFQARRRRYLLRVDLALGVLLAAVALLLAPGVAIVAVAALLVLAICIVSFAFGRRRSRRR
jgi:fatty acid desaturase